MGYKKASFIEGIAEKLGIIPNLHKENYQEFDDDMRHFSDEEVAKMYENLDDMGYLLILQLVVFLY